MARKCQGTTKSGKPCGRKPMDGHLVCPIHSERPAAPPRKLDDPTRRARLIEALRGGNYRETACQVAGIGTSTLYRWLEVGEADHQADKPSSERDVWEAVKEAEAQAEADALQTITQAADDSWQAAAWKLERKYPDRWGRRDRHDINAKVEHVTIADLVRSVDENEVEA